MVNFRISTWRNTEIHFLKLQRISKLKEYRIILVLSDKIIIILIGRQKRQLEKRSMI